MSTLTTWRKKQRRADARAQAAKADRYAIQEELERAARSDLDARQRLTLARDRATARLTQARRDRAHAAKVVARHERALVPRPERRRISSNCSSRGGSPPRRIVLHITVSHNRPGMSDLDGMLAYLDVDATDASAHVINDREGNDARCVPDHLRAWTQAAYNPDSLSIEQIEYSADRTRKEWMLESLRQLHNTAMWCAYWSIKYDIPLVHSTREGVCQHSELGAAGGGHGDCGAGYPIDYVIERARQYRADMRRVA